MPDDEVGLGDGDLQGSDDSPLGDTSYNYDANEDFGDREPAGGEEDEVALGDLFRQAEALGPEYAANARAIQKAMQQGYTPKLMERAELRKKFEPLIEAPPETVAWLNNLYQAVVSDPSRAADILRQESEALRGTPQETPSFDLDDEYATENERLLLGQLRQMDGALRELQAFKQQQEQSSQVASIQNGFAELEKTYGPIPAGDRVQVLQRMAALRVPPEALSIFWAGMNQERVMEAGRRQGVQTGVRKAGLGTGPSRLAARADDAPRKPKSHREALEMALSGE